MKIAINWQNIKNIYEHISGKARHKASSFKEIAFALFSHTDRQVFSSKQFCLCEKSKVVDFTFLVLESVQRVRSGMKIYHFSRRHISEIHRIKKISYIRMGLAKYAEFSLGKWFCTREKKNSKACSKYSKSRQLSNAWPNVLPPYPESPKLNPIQTGLL